MSDIDIARKAKKIHIRDVASKINIPEENLIPYGHDIAKIDFDFETHFSRFCANFGTPLGVPKRASDEYQTQVGKLKHCSQVLRRGAIALISTDSTLEEW